MPREARDMTVEEMAEVIGITQDLDDFGFGTFSWKKLGWWCELCAVVLGTTRQPNFDKQYLRYYRSVISHYRIVHPDSLIMIHLAGPYELPEPDSPFH